MLEKIIIFMVVFSIIFVQVEPAPYDLLMVVLIGAVLMGKGFIGMLVLSFVIDTMHWRHFWLFTGLCMGWLFNHENHPCILRNYQRRN